MDGILSDEVIIRPGGGGGGGGLGVGKVLHFLR